jgi:ribosomal protein L7/L12
MPPGVVELVRAGKTIAAIQEYRSATGAGLAEAKLAVESIR